MDSSTGLQVVSFPSNGTTSTPNSSVTAPSLGQSSSASANASDRADALVLSSISTGSDAADVSLDFNDPYKSLSISAQEILSKLNEILKGKLPDGLQSVAPEDATPEKTADTIVKGITALYTNYVKSNPELSPEEALTRFMAAARKGVDDGYTSAAGTLESLGAFEFSGVKDGIEKTRVLIEEKLKEFEATQRSSFTTTEGDVESQVKVEVEGGVLIQGGSTVYAVNSPYSTGNSPSTYLGNTSVNFVA